jgi:hypothetical protein
MMNQLPKTTPLRQKAYDVLDGERDYQDEHHPSKVPPSITDFANLLIEYTDKLTADVVAGAGSSPAGGPLKRLREIAAIAVHGMEVHGIQPRENHVPASVGITGTMHIVGKADSLVPPSAYRAPVSGDGGTKPVTTVAHPSGPHTEGRSPAPVPHTTEHPGAEKK